MQRLGLDSGQKQVTSTDAVMSAIVVDSEEEDEDDGLRLFRDSVSFEIFYEFLYY